LEWLTREALGGEFARGQAKSSVADSLLITPSNQEDFYAFASLSLDPEELRLSVKKHHQIDWDPKSVDDTVARQVVFVGIYDG
jgi:hypothetical protein